jgi:hypothetical protein
MLYADFGTSARRSYRTVLIWGRNLPTQMPAMRLEEEEGPEAEEAADYYLDDVGPFDTQGQLEAWWEDFGLRYKYPLYCILLATEADEHVVALAEDHRQELAHMAGDKCCFVYFRDLEKAKRLEPFRFAEHAKGVVQLTKVMSMRPDRLPCLLFFEQLVSGEVVYVDLKRKTVPELVDLLRELFSFLYSKKKVSLSAVKAFRLSKRIVVATTVLGRNLAQLGQGMAGELLKSLVRLP